jgi:hypothetical protein
MGQTAHGNATHNLTGDIIAESFRRNSRPLGAAEIVGGAGARARISFKDY